MVLLSISATPERVVVLDFKGEAQPGEKTLITDLIATKIDKYGLEVLTASDVREAVDLQAQGATLGCETDASCLADIASAMGAKYVVFGSIGRLGKNFLININIFDQTSAQSAARETIQAENLDVLPAKIDDGVTRLMSRIVQVAPPPAPPPAAPMNPMVIGGGAALGVGGLAALGFGVGALVFDGSAGAATSRKDFEDARGAGIGCLVGAGIGAAVGAAGGAVLGFALAE